MATSPRLILERFATLSFPRDEHGIADYGNPTVIQQDRPTYYGRDGLCVPDMQAAIVLYEPPSWLDRRVMRAVPIKITPTE